MQVRRTVTISQVYDQNELGRNNGTDLVFSFAHILCLLYLLHYVDLVGKTGLVVYNCIAVIFRCSYLVSHYFTFNHFIV